MKISDVQVIPFTVRRRGFHNAALRPETDAVQTDAATPDGSRSAAGDRRSVR